MLRAFRDVAASRGNEPEALRAVDRMLAEPGSAPMVRPSQELRTRIMDALRESERPSPMRIGAGWGWAGLAAACVVVGVVSWRIKPVTQVPSQMGPGIVALLPQGADPVIKLVAGRMNRPMLSEAQKVVQDTRRATKAVVGCVPFARSGG